MDLNGQKSGGNEWIKIWNVEKVFNEGLSQRQLHYIFLIKKFRTQQQMWNAN